MRYPQHNSSTRSGLLQIPQRSSTQILFRGALVIPLALCDKLSCHIDAVLRKKRAHVGEEVRRRRGFRWWSGCAVLWWNRFIYEKSVSGYTDFKCTPSILLFFDLGLVLYQPRSNKEEEVLHVATNVLQTCFFVVCSVCYCSKNEDCRWVLLTFCYKCVTQHE